MRAFAPSTSSLPSARNLNSNPEPGFKENMSSTTTTRVAGDIANLALADMGKKRIDWANQSMKVLQIIRKDFIKSQPLKGIRVSACLHVTAETANLAITMRDGGAEVVLCA